MFEVRARGKDEFREITIGKAGERVIWANPDAWALDDWTRDGKWIVFRGLDETSIRLLPTTGEGKPVIGYQAGGNVDETHVSPDGRWVAFNSDESGDFEVYVATFPSFEQKRQISSGGGVQPQWRADGKELYFLAADRKLMAVDIKAAVTLETGVPKALFPTSIVSTGSVHRFAVSPDGQKFYALEPKGIEVPELRIIANWPALLKR
jgi:hypothetical protein